LQFYIGTSGWSYSSWQGVFYPEKLEQKWWLPYYSQVFDHVEIDLLSIKFPLKTWSSSGMPEHPFSLDLVLNFPE
jgi:hypothetical protein